MIVCLFDIDGTLISSGGAGKAALGVGLAEEFGVGKIPDSFKLSGRTDRAIISDLLRLYDLPDTPENHRRLEAAYLRHLPACLGSVSGRVLPGILALLQRLSGRQDVAIGLLTGNVRLGAKAKLGHFGLFEFFAFGGYGDHHHDRDDVAREALVDAHRHLQRQVPAEQVWVIGDTPLDIRCARAIGARVVAVVTGWHTQDELQAHGPDLLLEDLSDPEPLLTHWPFLG